MDTMRIAELLQPFLATPGRPAALSADQLNHILMYIDLLLRWNARVQLFGCWITEQYPPFVWA